MIIYKVIDQPCEGCGTDYEEIGYFLDIEKATDALPYHGEIEEIEVIE
jgi:hypothetical protein